MKANEKRKKKTQHLFTALQLLMIGDLETKQRYIYVKFDQIPVWPQLCSQ